MAKTDFTAALGALSILARTASDIHSANLAVEEKNRDRLFAEEQSKLAKQHEINMQNDRQQHDIDQSRTAYQRETLGFYPTAEFDQNGDLIPTSIDVTQSMEQRSRNYDRIMTKFEERHIDTTGSEQDILDRNSIYTKALAKTSKSASGQVSPIISQLYGGDVTPGRWSFQDMQDFDNIMKIRVQDPEEGWSDYSPNSIGILAEGDYLPEDVVIDYSAGYPRLSEADGKKVEWAVEGIKDGIKMSQGYMNQESYEAYETK